MELSDKSLLLNILHLPRLGLSPEQVQKIEHVVGVRLVPKFKIHISRGAGPTRVCLEPVKVK